MLNNGCIEHLSVLYVFSLQESAQNDLQIDSSQYVPVMYRTQIEMSNVISAIPTLLILGFLFW